MLEQLGKSFELLLMNYGIWVALVLVLMVLIPVVLLIWMQKRHQAQDHQQLGGHYQSLAALTQQVNGVETILNQYQQQASRFGDATREQASELLAQQEDCLARAMRLKSELRETEARLPQIGDQVPGKLEDLEAEVTGLKASFERIEAWYKRLHQGVADARTQLHRLQSELESLPASPDLEPLWARLRELQAETTPADPVQYQQALEQLRQDIQAQRALPPLPAFDQAAEPVASPPVAAAPPAVAAAQDAPSAPVAAPTLSVPPPVPYVPANVPVPPTPIRPEDAVPAAPSAEAAAPQSEAPAVESEAEILPAAEPVFAGAPETVVDEAIVEGSVDNAILSPEATAPADPAASADAAPLPQDLVAETFLGQHVAEASDEAAEVAHDEAAPAVRDPQAEAFQDTVTETFLGQRGPEPESDERSDEASDAAETEAPASQAAESESPDSETAEPGDEAVQDEAPVAVEAGSSPEDTDVDVEQTSAEPEADLAQTETPIDDLVEEQADASHQSEQEAQAPEQETQAPEQETQAPEQDAHSPEQDVQKQAPQAMAKPLRRESAIFVEAGGRLRDLVTGLAQIESNYEALEDAFVPEAWPEGVPLLEQCRYRAAEAEELLKLARRLELVPQAPAHRVQLNLRRLRQKCEQIGDARAQLEQTLAELGGEAGRLEARLRKATERLQGLRDEVEQDWLHQQAGRLKEVYRGLESRPSHLPACRQKLRQVEIEIESQAQA